MKILSLHLEAILLFSLFMITKQDSQILSSVDFTRNIEILQYPVENMIGVSMYLPELLNYLTSDVFLTRVNASQFDGDWSNSFYQSIHVGLGYKYNCSSTIYGATVVCTKDLAANTSLLNALQKYIQSYTNLYGVDLGWDMERSNFSSSTYFNSFKAYMNIFYYDSINLELIDEGDKMLQNYNRTYTVANFQSDISTIRSKYSGLYVNGPGITQSANTTWVAHLPTICDSYYSTFTFRSILFKTTAEATIENLMSDYYSKGYLQRRFVNELGNIISINDYYVGINQIKQIDGNGINGITNTFASALWALDITLEFAAMGGFFINFYNPLSPSNQSFFGAGPLFEPAPIYYGVLFAIWALRNQPYIHKVPIVAGSSSNIKVYGLDDWGYRVLILNKDTDINANGIVKIKLNHTEGIRCSYLSAPSLSSTTNATFAGLSFKANSTEVSGHFAFFDYKSSQDGVYQVLLNYSQAALCSPVDAATYPNKLIRGDPRQMYTPQILISLFLIVIMISI